MFETHIFPSNQNYVTYGDAVFVRRCPKCMRFVKADDTISLSEAGVTDKPNAVCSKHGKVKMLFIGFN